MKKTILVLLMALVFATPCFAQEVEPEGLFSIEGTEWKMLPIMMMILPFPFIITLPPLPSLLPDFDLPTWGFDGGKVYVYNSPIESSSYVEMVVASIFEYQTEADPQAGDYTSESGFGVLQPAGIGFIAFGPSDKLGLAIGILVKINNNWTPPEVE